MTIPLAWREDGPAGGEPLVLLNSVGSSTEMWAPLLGPLAERFRVIRIDTRGHGASPGAARGPCTIADLGADVLAVLDGIGVQRVHLAGLSLGGMTGMWLAIHHPERVARLALLCTSAQLGPEPYRDRAAAVRARGTLATISGPVVERWVTAALAQRDPALVRRLRQMVESVDAESYAQCCEAIAALDLRADLGRIAAPTLVLAGAEDPATPPAHAEVIAAGIAGARLEVVAGAAHLATVEQPGAIARLLLQHLGADRRAAGEAVRRAVLGDAHVDRAGTPGFGADFDDFLTRYAWGEVWSRPGLARRERSIATLAVLVALGAEHLIAVHVRGALNNGLTADEVGEVLLHTAVYAGLPRANRAFAIAREVLGE